jgi:hypothetical protein
VIKGATAVYPGAVAGVDVTYTAGGDFLKKDSRLSETLGRRIES